MIDISSEPTAIQNLLKLITLSQENKEDVRDGYYLVADIKAEVVSAKKVSNGTDLSIGINQASGNRGIIKQISVIHQYPHTTAQVWEQVKLKRPDAKQSKFYKFIKDKNLKNKKDYSSYNFISLKQEENFKQGLLKETPKSLYNDNAVTFIINNL